MFSLKTFAASGLVALLAAPLAAFDMNAMTDAEREVFRAEIRAYLMDNPEVLLEAIDVLEERQAAEQAAGDIELVQVNAESIFNDGYSYVGGNPDGDITVVEFLDYRCGYCKRAHPEVTELIASDGNIRYIIKEFPILGEQSVLASRFAIAVKEVEGPEAYLETHDTLMTLRGEISEASLSDLSEQLGYDTPSVFDAMNSDVVQDQIAQNRQLAQRLQINGTPSFIFETEMLRGYAPLEAMRDVVEELRAEG
ncbi:MAG: DsbA family protein [Rhodobacter sp.]|nr:DsbA family protein [Rhodobacter sp.]